MPPHSSVGGARGSRPWIRSQTSDPMTPTLGTEGLVQKGLRRAVDAGRARQLAGHDAARGHRGLERAPRHLAAERHEQVIARRRHTPAELNTFIRLPLPPPRNLAVSFTTSSARSSPSWAA